MKYKIDKNSKKHLYIQIYEQIRSDVISGILPYGSKLPSKRLMASETGASLISVEHAYGLLTDEGYATSRERSGYFVTYRESDGFSRFPERVGAPPAVRQNKSGENFFPFSVLSKTVRKVIGDCGETLYDRCPGKGALILREAISAYLMKNKGIEASPDQIIVGSGAEWLYGVFLQMLGKKKLYAIEDPAYEKISQIYDLSGVRYEKLSLGADGITSDSLSLSRAKVLHVTPYRSYPTGISTSAAKRREYISFAKRNQAVIIEDDYLSEFSISKKSEETIYSISDSVRVIYVNSFARTICPTIRAAYAVLPPSLLPLYEKTVGIYACPVPTLEQYVIAYLLENGDFERQINRVRRKLRRKEQ